MITAQEAKNAVIAKMNEKTEKAMEAIEKAVMAAIAEEKHCTTFSIDLSLAYVVSDVLRELHRLGYKTEVKSTDTQYVLTIDWWN